MGERIYQETNMCGMICEECGALVAYVDVHDKWHGEQIPADLPEQIADPWETAIARLKTTTADWDSHLTGAVGLALYAQQKVDHPDIYRQHLVASAGRVRAMAPPGTRWDEPYPLVPGGERPRLRRVVRALLEADECQNFQNEDRLTYHLVNAEASLHGLWISAKGEG
jgi:hypothetical protein